MAELRSFRIKSYYSRFVIENREWLVKVELYFTALLSFFDMTMDIIVLIR